MKKITRETLCEIIGKHCDEDGLVGKNSQLEALKELISKPKDVLMVGNYGVTRSTQLSTLESFMRSPTSLFPYSLYNWFESISQVYTFPDSIELFLPLEMSRDFL